MFGFFKKQIHESPKLQAEDVINYSGLNPEDILFGESCDEVSGSYGEFGSATNPIPVNGVMGEIKYLAKLRSESGLPVFFHRIGSIGSAVVPNPVDVYEVVCVDGTMWTKLHFNMYHPRRSNKAPENYYLEPIKKKEMKDPPYGHGVNFYVENFPFSLPAMINQYYEGMTGKLLSYNAGAYLTKFSSNFEKKSSINKGHSAQTTSVSLSLEHRKLNIPSEDFSTIYSCQNCGRIISDIKRPCPHCLWYASHLLSFAKSSVLSNSNLKIPALLILSREVSKGRKPSEVVVNLEEYARKIFLSNDSQQKIKNMFKVLHSTARNNLHDMNMIRQCSNCEEKNILSQQEKCVSCDELISWSDSTRLLVCIDNLLWLFEQRIELSNSKEISLFICVLVMMFDKLLHKHKFQDNDFKEFLLSSLRSIKIIADLNRGAVIDTMNPVNLKIYVIKDNMLEDTKSYGLFILSELKFFVGEMLKE